MAIMLYVLTLFMKKKLSFWQIIINFLKQKWKCNLIASVKYKRWYYLTSRLTIIRYTEVLLRVLNTLSHINYKSIKVLLLLFSVTIHHQFVHKFIYLLTVGIIQTCNIICWLMQLSVSLSLAIIPVSTN